MLTTPYFKSEFERVLDENPEILYAPSYFKEQLAAAVTINTTMKAN